MVRRGCHAVRGGPPGRVPSDGVGERPGRARAVHAMTAVFLYGPLLDPDLAGIVLGAEVAPVPASLPGRALFRPAEGAWPIMAEAASGRVDGQRVGLDDEALARLDFYMTAAGAVAEDVALGGAPVRLYRHHGPAAGPFSLPRWQAEWGPIERGVAEEAMGFFGTIDAETLAFRRMTIGQRVSSRLRARAQPSPATLRSDMSRDAVRVIRRRQPYVHFFAVEESDLVHPRFAGAASAEVNRAALVGCDTVTVLPYDPGRDRVMMVEQFRFGVYARGDLRPWVLEPVAGRIDPGETPEEAARRETVEEAGLQIDRLLPVAAAYPSPGQITEYLHAYVGLAALPDAAAGLGGLDAENEDIRAHVVPFERMMALVASGEINSMPLVLSALWLDARRREGGFA